MPSGVPNATASTVRIRLPTMGFSKPPAPPGGGVISVKTASESPPTPFTTSTVRIKTSQVKPKTAAPIDSAVAR